MKKYDVMIGMPGASFCWGSIKAAIEATAVHAAGLDNSGNGFDDMDILWATALQRAAKGEITHFAMLHSDISPQPGWLDTLIEECDRLDADVVSTVVPMKDFRGITSTGISHPDDKWGGFRRIAINELSALPATFDAADCGYAGWPLLINTGCFVADLRKPIFFKEEDGPTGRQLAIDLNFPRKTFRDAEGNWKFLRESEDWHFSRGLHRAGAKYYATHKNQVRHISGGVPFPNYGRWGQQDHDEETRPLWEQGPLSHLDIEGWFDFADLYRERVQAVNGKPAHFVEVGSWQGKSAAYMAGQIKTSGKNIRFDAVDNWAGGTDSHANCGSMQRIKAIPATRTAVRESGIDLMAAWERNVAAAGVAEYVRPVRDDSTAAAARYADGSLDFVFIDADHEAESVYADLTAWWPKLKPGGTLAGHDYDEDGPREAFSIFCREKALAVQEQGRCAVLQSA